MIEARLRYTLLAIACLLALPPASALPSASAQNVLPPVTSTAPDPAFDVMAIKPNHSASGNVDIDTDDDRFTATNVSLKQLLENAYNIKQDLISGIPGPVDSARFDIEAKISEPDHEALKKLTPEQDRKLILPLLTERFQLKVHTETRILPVYELVLIPGGPKFKPSADQTRTGGGSMSVHGSRARTDLTARDAPMTSLAKTLAGAVHRTIIDKTGLKGNFDLTLQWSNDENPDSGAEQAPSIFTAVQEQLGLKLQPAKGPVETLVVDQATMPTEN